LSIAAATRDLFPLPPVGRTLIGGFESTYLPAFGVDGLEVNGHTDHRVADLDSLQRAGVQHLRYPLRWHRIEPVPGSFDWSETDEVLGRLRDAGAVVIVDLVHHTCYPDWLSDGFRGSDFADAFLRFTTAVAERYPWLPAYTLLNEPFTTFFFTGQQAFWPPYDSGVAGLTRLMLSVLPALSQAAQCWRELLPESHHVWVDTAEHHRGIGAGVRAAEVANERRHLVLDLALGRFLDPTRPSLRALLDSGGESLLELPPLEVDVLGLDYYCHSEWYYDDHRAWAPSPQPVGFAAIAEQYGERYGLPMMLTETNLRGLPTDRIGWLRYTLEQYELALSRGVDLRGYCWFPQVDSCDWDTLLARCRGRADPVGVLSLAGDGGRLESSFTEAWRAAAAGAPASDLPAYHWQAPNDHHLAGFLPSLGHWPWQEPPPHDRVPAIHIPLAEPNEPGERL
jgi:beta-glucosidase/6-phospho-beta-glucosidase/beta-galactosidase